MAPPVAEAELHVPFDSHYIHRANGSPFFWLGDTAWELFHRSNFEEAEVYLQDRRRKGFTVIQAVVLTELSGSKPNAYGHLPLQDNDPHRPNEAYFKYVDRVIDLAEAKGLYVALLPAWGDKFNKKWGLGPEILTATSARAFGAFLGNRYKEKPVVWVLGGDRNPETADHLAIVKAMADGITSSGSRQLMTYHPQGGGRSWWWFHDGWIDTDRWIDFHMFQSGHSSRDLPNYRSTLEARKLNPSRPVIDGEPRYEDHPVDFQTNNGRFDDFDVRQAAWWSVLSGAAGHTYGNHNVWQMWQPPRVPITSARTPWKEALNQPGAAQMGYLRRFVEQNGFGTLEPAQELLADNIGGAGHQRAARSGTGDRVIVYTPTGSPIRLRAKGLSGMAASWFDPRSGSSIKIGNVTKAHVNKFSPPGVPGRGNDWVLLVAR
jgi:hypothetical protein